MRSSASHPVLAPLAHKPSPVQQPPSRQAWLITSDGVGERQHTPTLPSLSVSSTSRPGTTSDVPFAPLLPQRRGDPPSPEGTSELSQQVSVAESRRGRGGSRGLPSPYAPGSPFLEDLIATRKRVRKLEVALRAHQAERARLLADDERYKREALEFAARAEAECEENMQSLQREHAQQLEERVQVALERQVAELVGSADERARVQREREREERARAMAERVTRRMLNASLADGWDAWSAYYSSRVHAREALRQCAKRLVAPDLAATFDGWAADWREAALARKLTAQAEAGEAGLRLEVARLKSELTKALEALPIAAKSAAADKTAALEAQRVALVGSAEDQAGLRAKREREERVQSLSQRVMRRILNRDISLGFGAWVEMWEARTHAMTTLRDVSNRLRAPEKQLGFAVWRGLVEEEKRVRALEKASGEWSGLQAEHAALREECDGLRQELSRRTQAAADERAAALEAQRVALVGSAAEQAALHYEQHKEERIALLRRQIGRRLLNQGTRKAWTTWHDQWRAVVASRREKQGSDASQREQLLSSQLRQAGEELVELREAMAVREAAMARDKEAALERQRMELTGDAAQAAEAVREAEKEARVSLMQRQFVRRLMQRELSGAWGAWADQCAARRHALWRLRHAANVLMRPQLSAGFDAFRRHREGALHRAQISGHASATSMLEAENLALSEQLRTAKVEYGQRLKYLSDERVKLLAKVAELSGGTAEHEAMLEAQRANAKEEHIEAFRRQFVRRMLHADVAAAWTSWTQHCEAHRHANQLLRRVANRMHKPHLSDAFDFWAFDCAAAATERATAGAGAMAAREADLRAELAATTVECERRIAAMEVEKEAEIERRLVELTGSYSQRLEAKEKAAKAERVELLRRQMARRVLNRDISLGFGAWVEMWEARTHAMTTLRDVSNRFAKPDLATAFGAWAESKAAEEAEKEKAAIELESKSFETQLRHSRFEVGQLQLLEAAHADELTSLRERLESLTLLVDEANAKVEAAAPLPYVIEDLTTRCEQLVVAAAHADAQRVESEKDAARQRGEDVHLLEKLLRDQRSAFEADLARLREQMTSSSGSASETAAGLREELTASRKDLGELQSRLDEQTRTHASVEATRSAEVEQLRARAAAEAEQRAAAEEARRVAEDAERAARDEAEKLKAAGGGGTNLGVELDLHDGRPIKEQLAEALGKHATRVIDLFRQWDTDGDGEVSKAEFRKAMPLLGLDAPKADIDSLFSEWDVSGDGALNFAELKTVLKKPLGKVKSAGAGAKAASLLSKK